MDIAAYYERESYDPQTGEPGILRDEWRVRHVREYPYGVLEEHFGPDWRRSRPFAEYVLEHRYIRRGIEEPWTPFDAANTYEQALENIDAHATAIDPALTALQEARAEYARQRAEEEERRRLTEIEKEERKYRETRSAEAFTKLLSGKQRAWAERWNKFVESRRGDEEFLSLMKEDERFMELYSAVLEAYTVPAKVKAIKGFLEEFGGA